MKKLLLVVSLCVLVIPFSIAQQQDHQSHGDGKAMMHGDGKGMMHGDGKAQMTELHTHMQAMHDLMKQINAEKDPQKRHELLQQHMATMQKGMGMMMGMQKGMMMGQGHGDDHQGMHKMDSEQHAKMMDHHMQMMQTMMDQMKAHTDAMAKE